MEMINLWLKIAIKFYSADQLLDEIVYVSLSIYICLDTMRNGQSVILSLPVVAAKIRS